MALLLSRLQIFTFENFVCPIVKIDQNTKLKCQLTKRRSEEEPYLQIKALNGSRLKTNVGDNFIQV